MRTKKLRINTTENVNAVKVDSVIIETLKTRKISAHILSVFDNTINLINSKDTIITITHNNYIGPYSIQIEKPEILIPYRKYYNIKSKAKIDKNNVSISYENLLNIDLSNAVLWKSQFNKIKTNYQNLKDSIPYIKTKIDLLLKKVPVDNFTLYENLTQRLNNVKEPVKSMESHPFKFAVLKLIGLGTGLTPSADDSILGLLAIYKLIYNTNPNKNIKFFLDNIKDILTLFKKKTTELSFQFIKLALDNVFSDPVEKLLLALNSGNYEKMDIALDRLNNLGDTSGLDLLLGIHFALENHQF